VAENGDVSAEGLLGWPDGIAAPRRLSASHLAGLLVLALAIAAVAVVVMSHARGHPAQMLRVISGSMRPTLAIGQIVRVDPSAYASAEPRIGDIVAFHAPAGATGETPSCGVAQPAGAVCPQSTGAESGEIFIKRVVAQPGDMIAVIGGSVLRDGELERAPFTAACDGASCNFPVSVQVPTGEWFLMGDDRATSDDSRYWGAIPKAWIVGKVVQ
jgi:signal peptidase I